MLAVALGVLDIVLVLGLTLRLTHLVTTDYLGEWFIRHPAETWARDSQRRKDLVLGLECPWCLSFHIGWILLVVLYLFGGPGHLPEWFRYVAGAFTLSYLVGAIEVKVNG